MSKSSHQMEIRAVDQTGGAFSSIAGKAAAAGNGIRSMLGGALTMAAGYLSFQAVKGGIGELGHLTDIAQKAGMTVDELTAATTAFGGLGLQNMGVDQFAKALDYMQKTTGRTGMAGFYKTIEEIGKIPDVAARGQEAMKVFGRTGMELMPLIVAAGNGTDAIRGMVDAMPLIPQAAADAGDNVADAMDYAVTGVKSIWLQGIGAICGFFDELFVGGIKEAALQAVNWLEFAAKSAVVSIQRAWIQVTGFTSKIGAAAGAWFNLSFMEEGATFGDVWQGMKDAWNSEDVGLQDDLANFDEKTNARMLAWQQKYEDKKANIAKFLENESKAVGRAGGVAGEDAAKAEAFKSTRINNSLIMANSNEAAKIAAFGPQMAEDKKQTQLLEKIAQNTAKSANSENLEIVE